MLFSIVVPVYNVEKYIEDCLESIIYQIDNEKNYEIILVDDGSTDRSGLICDEYQRRTPNINILISSFIITIFMMEKIKQLHLKIFLLVIRIVL